MVLNVCIHEIYIKTPCTISVFKTRQTGGNNKQGKLMKL